MYLIRVMIVITCWDWNLDSPIWLDDVMCDDTTEVNAECIILCSFIIHRQLWPWGTVAFWNRHSNYTRSIPTACFTSNNNNNTYLHLTSSHQQNQQLFLNLSWLFLISYYGYYHVEKVFLETIIRNINIGIIMHFSSFIHGQQPKPNGNRERSRH